MRPRNRDLGRVCRLKTVASEMTVEELPKDERLSRLTKRTIDFDSVGSASSLHLMLAWDDETGRGASLSIFAT